MTTVNLVDEVLECLAMNGRAPEEVVWVGNAEGTYVGSWDDFVAAADKEYDDQSERSSVAIDLVVVGADWWLERAFFLGGTRGWAFKAKPLPDVPSMGLARIMTCVDEPQPEADFMVHELNYEAELALANGV